LDDAFWKLFSKIDLFVPCQRMLSQGTFVAKSAMPATLW